MTGRACCLCGARRLLKRFRQAEIKGGPAQWVCAYGCQMTEPIKRR